MLALQLGQWDRKSNLKAKRVFRWRSRSAEDAVVAKTESLERFVLSKTRSILAKIHDFED